MCKYCEETTSKGCISGKNFNVIPTVYLKAKTNYDRLNCFILKCKEDEKAGFMIGTYEGYCYIDINYCPMCGRKIGENMENKDISRIVHNTLRRIDNYGLDIVRMKVKDIKYVLEYCVSLEKERDGIYSDYQDLGKEKLNIENKCEEQEKMVKKFKAYSKSVYDDYANAVVRLQEKDKIIDLMAEYISNVDIDEDVCKKVGKNPFCDEYGEESKCVECVVDYFKKKARDEK